MKTDQLVLLLLVTFLVAIFGEEECKDEAELKRKAKKLISAGDAALMKKQYREAVRIYSEAIKLDPSNSKHYYQRFRAHDKTGNYKAALRDVNKALDIDPDYATGYAFRGKTLLSMGRCPEAADDYSKVLSLKPKHGDAKKKLPIAEACANDIKLAENYINSKRYDLADQKLTEVIEVTGKAPYLKYLRAKTRYYLGKYFESIRDAGDVLKVESDNPEALLIRGMAYYRVADHEMAIRHFRNGLKTDPEHKELKSNYKRLQKLLKLVKKGEDALKIHNEKSLLEGLGHFREAIQIDPTHSEYNKEIHTKICRIYAKMKNTAKAKESCDAAIKLDPSLLEPHVIYADLLLKIADETPDFEEALRMWQRAQEIDRDDHRVREGIHKTEVGLKQSKQKNYYKILGLKRDCGKAEIKKAYRKLAKDFHPDRNMDKTDEEKQEMEGKFALVAEAYEVLSDDELRRKYDAGEDVFPNQGNENQRRGGFPFGRRGGTNFHFNF